MWFLALIAVCYPWIFHNMFSRSVSKTKFVRVERGGGRGEMGLMNGWYKFHFAIGLITGLMKIYFLAKIYNRVFKYFIPFWIISNLHCNCQNHTCHVIYWCEYPPIWLHYHKKCGTTELPKWMGEDNLDLAQLFFI